MITSEKEKVFRIFYLEGEQQQYGLDLHGASPLIIPQEEVIGLGWPPFHVKNLPKVRKLPVYISHNFHWGLQLKKNWLVCKNVLSSETKIDNVFFTYFHVVQAIYFFGVNTHLLVLF